MPLALRFPAALVRRRTARPEGCQQDRPIADDGATGLPTGERALDLSEQDSVGCSPLRRLWTVEELDACFVVKDSGGQQLANRALSLARHVTGGFPLFRATNIPK